MHRGFQIEHQCPQCGAPAILEETDRLFTCDYCRVQSYLLTGDVFRYRLPHKTPAEQELTYFPYWRFRGTLYNVTPAGIQERIVDASFQGVESKLFPVSLGVRAQTLKLRFATKETPGKFIRPTMSAAQAAEALAERVGEGESGKIFHQEFIGETLSLIFSPFYVEKKIIDGVLNRAVSPVVPEGFLEGFPVHESPQWNVHFIPTLCPHCGWDLAGERDSLVLTCSNCRSAWQSVGDGLDPVEFECLPGGPETAAYLPFWRIEADVTGIEFSSYADLVRLANLPKVVQAAWKVQPVQFWTPAFKVRPQLFVRLARSLTLAQPHEDPVPGLPQQPAHPVTLPLSEATESLKILLAHLMVPRARWYPKLPEVRIVPRSVQVVFIPFRERATELTHAEYRLAINKNALRYGLVL